VAAELAVPDRGEQRQHLGSLRVALATSATRRVGGMRADVAAERRSLETFRPAAYLAAERERIGLLLDRATRGLRARVAGDRAQLARHRDRLPAVLRARTSVARAALERSAAGLAALDPFATLERGYAIVRATDGRVVVDAATRRPGDRLDVRLARGALDVSVHGVRDSAS
jgi:exodeoxyribonuclease VII large subunit